MLGPRDAEFLALAMENSELRLQLAELQDQCVELAVDNGALHAEIEALSEELAALRSKQSSPIRTGDDLDAGSGETA